MKTPKFYILRFIEKQIKLPKNQQLFAYRWFSGGLSWLYRSGLHVRKLAYRYGIYQQHKLPGTVISIGNLVVGGTGKSPLIIHLAKWLLFQRYRPVILSRGYRSSLKTHDYAILLDGEIIMTSLTSTFLYADEAFMQSKNLPTVPVIIARNRKQAAQFFLKHKNYHVTHWLLDDGFSHLSLERDYNILLLDAEQPFGSGSLLPQGTLRECVTRVKDADRIIFTRTSHNYPSLKHQNLIQKLYNKPFSQAIFTTQFPCHPINSSKTLRPFDLPVLAIACIANPQSFLDSLSKHAISVRNQLILRDHDRLNIHQITKKIDGCRSIMTTEKDYWRDPELWKSIEKPVFVLPLKIQFLGDDSWQSILNLSSSLKTR